MDPQTQQLIAQLSPAAQGILSQVDPQTAQDMITILQSQGPQVLEDALRQFALANGIPYDEINQQGGGQQLPPDDPTQGGAPPMPDPTMVDPNQGNMGASAPPPMPAGDPSAMPPAPPVDPMAQQGRGDGPPPPDPALMAQNAGRGVDKNSLMYEEEPKAWEPGALPKHRYSKKKPTLERVLEDAKTGHEVWKDRDFRIALDTSMFHGEYGLNDDSYDDPNDGMILEDGSLFHRSANPNGLIHRTAGVVAAFQDRITRNVPKRHESDPYVKAAQKYEDYCRGSRMEDEAEWFRRGSTMGDPQMALPFREAGLMALEGGMGWKWDVDPDDENHPFKYELIPVSQLYPLGHATTRQFTLPLEMARAEFDEIDEAFPMDDRQNKAFYETTDIEIIEWADTGGYFYAVAYREDSPRSSGKQANGWIIPPRKIGYGFPYFNYVIWGGTPASPNNYNRATHNKNVGYGVLTPLRKTYRLMDIMVSAIATGALKMQNPALFRTVQEGRDMSKVPRLNTEAGAENKGRVGEEVKPMYFDIAATQAGVAFIQALSQELQNNIPPMLAGMTASSGFEYMQRSDDAHAMIIKPMVDALQRSYEEMDRQRGILSYRFARRDKKKDEGFLDKQFFTKYAYTGTDKRGYSYSGTLKVNDLRKSGVFCQVRYTEKSLTEQIQIASLVTQLVNAHLMSQEQALIKLGNDDPIKELKKIFQDAALMQPEVLKAVTETSIMNSGSDLLIDAWNKAFAMEAMAGQQGGSPAGPAGVPSMPNVAAQPGGSAPRLPNEQANPTAQMQGSLT